MSKPTKKFTTQASLDSHIWAACDILRRSNCAGALQYVPELTWLLFLRILDIKEEGESEVAATLSKPYQFSLEEPYRWKDWAAPFDKKELEKNPKAQGNKRYTLTEKSSSGTYFQFVNQDLLPYLKKLRDKPNATSRQKVISEMMWTIDITQKKKTAKLEADTLRKSAKAIQDTNPILDKKQEEEVKDLLKKASAIEDSVYDLKAVNPNRKSEEDNRTPKELIDFIQKKDLEISKLLASLS